MVEESAQINDRRLSQTIAFLRSVWLDPLTGLVAAGIFDSQGRSAIAASQYGGCGRWRHAENLALERFLSAYGAPSADAVAVVTLAPCTHPVSQSRLGPPCAVLLGQNHIQRIHAGAIDKASYPQTEADYSSIGIRFTLADDQVLRLVCEQLAGIFAKYGRRVNEDIASIKREIGPP
jgi:pyrimidine deaminase RibD-like protein